MEALAGIGGFVVAALVATLLLIPNAALVGYTILSLWAWFVVPIFHLPALTWGQAIGLSLLVSFMTAHYRYKPAPEKGEFGRLLAHLFVTPLVTLGFGWLIQRWCL